MTLSDVARCCYCMQKVSGINGPPEVVIISIYASMMEPAEFGSTVIETVPSNHEVNFTPQIAHMHCIDKQDMERTVGGVWVTRNGFFREQALQAAENYVNSEVPSHPTKILSWLHGLGFIHNQGIDMYVHKETDFRISAQYVTMVLNEEMPVGEFQQQVLHGMAE